MRNKFLFRIISDDGKVYSDAIEELYIETDDGVVGVLYGHAPMIARIKISAFKIKKNNEVKYFAISGGLLNVEKNTVYILANTFEEAKELDKERIIKAKELAEIELKNKKHDEEGILNAEFELKKALNRLRLIK
ncbi:MAG: ATP synthase F1 subunit epsilon [Bacillales bacterium]